VQCESNIDGGRRDGEIFGSGQVRETLATATMRGATRAGGRAALQAPFSWEVPGLRARQSGSGGRGTRGRMEWLMLAGLTWQRLLDPSPKERSWDGATMELEQLGYGKWPNLCKWEDEMEA